MSNRRGPMRHGPGVGMAGEKAKDLKGTMKKLIKYIRRYYVPILFVILFAIASTIFNIVGPTILGDATTEIFNGLIRKVTGTGGINFDKVTDILMTLMGLYVVSAAFSFAQGLIMTHVSNNITYQMRKDISEKIHRMPMKYFESRTYGEVLSRVTNDIDTLGQSLNQSMTQIITSATQIIGVLVMMIRINIPMTVVVLLTLPLSMGLIGIIMGKSQPYFKAQQANLGELNGQVEEIYSGHNIVKAFNKEESVIEDFEEVNGRLYQSAWKSQFFSGAMMPLMQFVGNLGYVLVAILGGFLVIRNTIEVGQIQSFIQYVRSFNQPITQLAQVGNMMQTTAASAERVFEFLEEEEETEASQDIVPVETLKGNVSFEHVHFGYNPEQTIIHDFSVNVKEGQKVAIVGPTGAGKTTLIKLLMRFYDVNGGCIKIDGYDIREFIRGDIRQMFGMVLQDTWLYNASIRDNIRYGKLDASEEEIQGAARAAFAHHFIVTQPGGYDMVINEESNNISQGQKQLLTIARAILADPKILILDEATSSVDTRTEERIQMAMDNLMQGRTSFIIAHRLSTIRDADVILVMNHGDIVEQGNHEELLAKGGFYADLYNSQFESA
ncbi:MAG TPA: ABC transporter ATP-binding protein/permease [Candidatus Anaerostipes avistercoris]|uniref:ABC transporter ATP-binding protein/permease n=1 Tax=Candidatus Anaerostipes avistercoris TaxID=2838462 RepID=A0A9D2PID8_9FIRM|nr:ABC transporter ATP-binding protein/permease [Candidatus Anaerostipes avistercoris]